MIRPAEIQQIARNEGVRDTQIEKDYIISWILTGIAQNELLSSVLVFKGGTVLKKFYFEDYRYSEDLDFTLLDTDKANDEIKSKYSVKYILLTRCTLPNAYLAGIKTMSNIDKIYILNTIH